MDKKIFSLILLTGTACFIMNDFMLNELKILWKVARLPFFDFPGQWALCAYTFQGIDPYPLRGMQPPLIEEIGFIPLEWSTSPWGLVLGNFFYPGFLDLREAMVYFTWLNYIFFVLTAFIVSKKLKCGLGSLSVFFVTITMFTAHFLVSEYFGNAGAVICCLMILSCLYADERPIAAGVMLAFAMIKPQVALPICFALLLRKNFKVFFTAAKTDLAAWGVAALITNQTPLTLLSESMAESAGGKAVFSGLFTMLFPDDKFFAMSTSMLAGTIFIFLTQRMSFGNEKFFWACPAFLSTTFFAYSFHNEFLALLLPALACLYLAAHQKFFREKIFWLAAMIFMSTAPYALYLSLSLWIDDKTELFWTARTTFAAILILLGCLMAKKFSEVSARTRPTVT